MVIDTDGSAFITKAEFDSLKNSFQSQIDSYNSSIDSKIDGAIAAYLSGITISTVNTYSTVLPKGKKVTSGYATKEYYKRGWITGQINSSYFRGYENNTDTSRTCSCLYQVKFQFYQDSNEENNKFNKLYCTNIDRVKGIADYKEYNVGCKEELRSTVVLCSSLPVSPGSIDMSSWGTYSKLTVPTGTSLDRYNVTNGDITKVYRLQPNLQCGNTSAAAATGMTVATNNPNNIDSGVTTFSRINGVSSNDLLLVNISAPYNHFIDYDNPGSNFSNDNQKITGEYKLYSTTTIYGKGQKNSSSSFVNSSKITTYTADSSEANYYYEGFANDVLVNWNQIYNSAFDITASLYNDDDCVKTDSKGVKHLMCYAGLPICSLVDGDIFEYTLQWDDPSKEYDVWVKRAPFEDIAPDNETNLELNIKGIRSGTNIDRGSNNYLTLKSGDKLVINSTSSGYVFIKWREKDDPDYGGGTLISTGVALVTASK